MWSKAEFNIKDIEDYLLEASKQEKDKPFKLIIRGHRDAVIQWMEMFDKNMREQCGKI